MTDRDRETLTDLQMRARLAFYAEHYAAFGEWPDTPKDGDVLLVAIRSLLEENERLRVHTKKCNDLVLRLARQAAKDQGFELDPKHDVQGLLASALHVSHDRQVRIKAALALHKHREHAAIPEGKCANCGYTWPCSTYKALKGEEGSDD